VAKEKQQWQMTPKDVADVRHEGLPIWSTAVAKMAVDRVDVSELKIKEDSSLSNKYPLFHTSLVNTIASHLITAKDKAAEYNLNHPEVTDTIKNHISGPATFQYYRQGHLVYKTHTGLEFPIPISDTNDATFPSIEKGIFFMRWIRKHLDSIDNPTK